MNIDVRLARHADLPQLVRLLAFLFAQEVEFRADESLQKKGLLAILADSRIGHIWVATIDASHVVGMVSVLATISTALGGPVGLLEDFVVDPACRGQGVGRKLLHAALDGAQNKVYLRMTLLTDADNQNALKLYREFGFVDSPMRVLRRGW
jgi:ribosomal protein S18 acetylase RimI-like enzyme